jgi:hypothetical protein
MLRRHIAAFVVSAALVIVAHFVLRSRQPSFVDVNSERLVTSIYDVRPIRAAMARNFSRIPPAAPYELRGSTQDGIIDPAIGLTLAEYDEALMSLVCSRIEAWSWDFGGWHSPGGPGRISAFDGRLIVKQTPRVHAQVRELLDAMEALSAEPYDTRSHPR